jgi:hypothetical protein
VVQPGDEQVDFEISLEPLSEAPTERVPQPTPLASKPGAKLKETEPALAATGAAPTPPDATWLGRPVLPPSPEAGIRPTESAQQVAHNVVRRRGQHQADASMPALLKASAEDEWVADAAEALLPQPDLPEPVVRKTSAQVPKKAPSKAAAQPGKTRKPSRDKPQATPPEEDLSFVREAKRRQFWRQPWVRLVLVLGVCALLLGVGLRWVHGHRDWLAAAYPDTRPALQRMCSTLGCEVQPYRMLDAIVIDSSSFNRSADGSFRLNLSLRNGEPLDVATPSFELTLTDADDRAVLQQTVTPHMLNAPAVLRARRDWSGGLPLRLDPAMAAQVAGYRLLALYP